MKGIKKLWSNMKKISVRTEFFYFLFFLLLYFVLSILNYFAFGHWLLSNDNFWLWSGLVMLIFSLYYIEPYFTAPTNVFANSFALFMLVLSIDIKDFGSYFWWIITLITLFLIIALSLFSKAAYDKNKSDEYGMNKVTKRINTFLSMVGSGKILYSITFIYFLLLNIFSKKQVFQNWYLLGIFLIFCFVLAVPPKYVKSLLEKILNSKKDRQVHKVGQILAIESEKVFLIEVLKDQNIDDFSPVYFRTSSGNPKDEICLGFVFGIYYRDNEKWGKIIKIKALNQEEISSFVGEINPGDVNLAHEEIKEEDKFVGVVCEKSNINKVYFEYSQKKQSLEIDDLLELMIRGKKVFYQVTNACTCIEKIEKYNEKKSITGEAIQLGSWNSETQAFDKIGWVPSVNEPVYIANTKEEETQLRELSEDEMSIGFVPKTRLPSIVKLNDAISHHTAILGISGSGKSVLARKIIKKIKDDTKVICVDFTGEYVDTLSELSPSSLIEPDQVSKTEELLIEREKEQEKGRGAEKDKIFNLKKQIQTRLLECVQKFIESSEEKIAIFELPELSNTTFILEFTQFFLEAVFDYAKSHPGSKICIVLEEAHTIVPETSFLGEPGDYGSSKNLVNKMSQIALQGRKYGVGLLVIGQRSANISKTVLTQCNTIVAFKAFDDTSYGFLANYFGRDATNAIPNLKNYHAVVYGKGIKSNCPMIIDTYDKDEDTRRT